VRRAQDRHTPLHHDRIGAAALDLLPRPRRTALGGRVRACRGDRSGIPAILTGLRLVPLLLAAALLAGCGSASTAPKGPPLETECGDLPEGLHAKPIWLHTLDGVRLYAATTGRGSKAVVLLHESPANLCGWLPTMQLLADHGMRAIAVDFRGNGHSAQPRLAIFLHLRPDIEAAIKEARDEGSDKVFLMGASLGGAAALTHAPSLKGLAGVISLSGELKLPNFDLDAIDAVPKLRVPLLTMAARDDGSFNADDAHTLIRATGSRDKRLAIFPSSYHGWDLIQTAPYQARAQKLLLDWLDGH
jgi:alpha-beta hydrolase superfamily lysophospholipase